MSVRLVYFHASIPCSSAPTILDIMLVKIGLTVDLKRPSTGAARKSEEGNLQVHFCHVKN